MYDPKTREARYATCAPFGMPQGPERDRFAVVVRSSWTENVEPGVPPDVDGSDAWREYAASRFTDPSLVIPVNDEIEQLAYEYKAQLENEKAAEAAKKVASNKLLVALGDARRAEGNGVKVTHSVYPGHYPDYKAIIAAAKVAPGIIEEFTRTSEEHRVTVTIKAA